MENGYFLYVQDETKLNRRTNEMTMGAVQTCCYRTQHSECKCGKNFL